MPKAKPEKYHLITLIIDNLLLAAMITSTVVSVARKEWVWVFIGSLLIVALSLMIFTRIRNDFEYDRRAIRRKDPRIQEMLTNQVIRVEGDQRLAIAAVWDKKIANPNSLLAQLELWNLINQMYPKTKYGPWVISPRNPATNKVTEDMALFIYPAILDEVAL